MIRKATPDDFAELTELWLRASCQAHPFIAADFWQRQQLAMPQHYLPLAKNYVYQPSPAAPLAGFASVVWHKLAALFVAPEQQGQGIGWALLTHVTQLQPLLELDVFEQNLDALRFYYRFGCRLKERGQHPETQAWQLTLVYP